MSVRVNLLNTSFTQSNDVNNQECVLVDLLSNVINCAKANYRGGRNP